MLTDDIARSVCLVEDLRAIVHEIDIPDNPRTRAAGACFAIAQEYHQAIVRLIEWKLYAAAFALVRLEFEAYVRGEWLSSCAKDNEIEEFLNGNKEPPKINCLINQLETLELFNVGVLSEIKEKNWRAMCDFTHTGMLHVQRWNKDDGIQANYFQDEILEVINFASHIASFSVIGLANLADNEALIHRIIELMDENFPDRKIG
ncbi:MAG: hypothetical protein KJ725_16425 [Gammaproteobacteria bacterium]|nr:hypothetical protein [Gammaproteobacteria bacterium]